jgi:hypothetical protein
MGALVVSPIISLSKIKRRRRRRTRQYDMVMGERYI